jgi:transcriptional regulator with XRE-family HTH domain
MKQSTQPGKMTDPLELRLRELRRERNLTLRELSEKSGLAINTLSMIETGKTSPSVSTLQQLARALGVPITAFFASQVSEQSVVHVRHDKRPQANMENTKLESLGEHLSGAVVQPFVVTLPPGADSGAQPIVHSGYEFAYCLSGEVSYIIDEQTYPLEAGDSLVFESCLPHCWQNTGTEPAKMILVMHPTDVWDSPAKRHFKVLNSIS